MIFNEKIFEGERPPRHQPYRIRQAPSVPRAAAPAAKKDRLPAGIAIAIITLLALGLWSLIIFTFRAVILD